MGSISSTVKRDLFGMETWGKAVSRIKGEINADFLPVTSDRSNFVTDSDEFGEFLKVIMKVVSIIRKTLGREADRREDRKASFRRHQSQKQRSDTTRWSKKSHPTPLSAG